MSELLFSEFDPVTSKEWKQKIQMGLKGADYNDALVWQSLEGIHVKPFYHREDFKEAFPELPGTPEHWDIVQQLYVDDVEIAHKLAMNALSKGATALFLRAAQTFDLESLFEGMPLETCSLYFDFEFLDVKFLEKSIRFLDSKKCQAYFRIDLIHHLASRGNWFESLEKDHEKLDTLVHNHPHLPLLGIDTSLYQNAGATIVQQLAYGLAHTLEYLNHFQDSFKKQIPTLTFTVAIGSNYFFEIAKIRALRWLLATLSEGTGIKLNCHILAIPSKRNKTLYDYNVNMLRTTTECMSAILGGADAICNRAYDSVYHKSNEFGERISRNQLLILKSEGYFDWVSNPVDGTYYIERLTKELAEKALEVFKEIERGGGFLKLLKNGTLQRKIAESAQKEQALFDAGTLVLVGTNKYPNPSDRMNGELELYPFLKKNPRKTIIEPILEKRLSEKIEKERLENEK